MRSLRSLGDGVPFSAPVTPAPVPAVGSFVICPLVTMGAGAAGQGWMAEVYRMAYRQAELAARPPWFERVYAMAVN